MNSNSANYDTINVRNHKPNGPLQECHEEHDEDGVHYENSTQIIHPPPRSKSNQVHYTSSHPPLPELHPSSPSNGSPSELTSMTPPWLTLPIGPKSPENEGGNVAEDEEIDPPWKMMVNSSCVATGDGPGAECKKAGV